MSSLPERLTRADRQSSDPIDQFPSDPGREPNLVFGIRFFCFRVPSFKSGHRTNFSSISMICSLGYAFELTSDDWLSLFKGAMSDKLPAHNITVLHGSVVLSTKRDLECLSALWYVGCMIHLIYPDNHIFSNRPRDARALRGITEYQASKKLGISQNLLIDYESSRCPIPLEFLFKLMSVYNLPRRFFHKPDTYNHDHPSSMHICTHIGEWEKPENG